MSGIAKVRSGIAKSGTETQLRRAFHTLDVFTDTPFAGNPLAVVLDSIGLDAAQMQAIAREFNLSETVFVRDAGDPVNTARLRIFTPQSELPFAGHPTIGAAALIAHLRAPGHIAKDELRVVLEETVGDIVCMVRAPKKGALYASFIAPKIATRIADLGPPASLASALSLAPEDIGMDGHLPGVWSAGGAFAFVPVASRAALSRARPQAQHFGAAFGDVIGAFLYTSEVERPGSDVRARMFAPAHGIAEDPATGSAAAAFAGVAVAYEKPADGEHTLVIEQGFDMGRPSLITVGLAVEDGALTGASIGGAVVLVSQGFIEA